MAGASQLGSGGSAHRLRRRTLPVALILGVAAGLLAVAPPAVAGTFSVSGATATYTANSGEVNQVTMFASGDRLEVQYGGSSTSVVPPCTQGDAHHVSCPKAGVTQVHLVLGDLDDSADFDGSFPPIGSVVEGGDGKDTLEGTFQHDTLDGGTGNDSLDAGAGDDTVNGGEGDDSLDGGSNQYSDGSQLDGADTYSGGAGLDTIDYHYRLTPLVVTLDGAADDGAAGEKDNVGPDVESVIGGSEGDRLVGSGADNNLDGRGGDDLLDGGDGNDTLDGGAGTPGDDSLTAGAGNDALTAGPGDDSLKSQAGADTADGGGGADTVDGGDGADTVMGGAGIDTVNGGPGNDTVEGAVPALVGADGSDKLSGDSGNDALLGGDGDDLLDGGTGADAVSGEAGTDTADYSARTASIGVSLDSTANDGATGEGDNVGQDTENIDGGTAPDTLIGDASANELTGGAGEDYIDGASGGDRVSGGDSADVLRTRNGVADQVACGGRSSDFVIADSKDQVDPDCKRTRVDRGENQKPRLGTAAVVKPVTGLVRMSPSGIHRQVPLQDAVVLPTHSLVNATGGNVSLVGARGGGRAQSGQFRGGEFRFTQSRGRHPVTELALAGGNLSKCGRARPVVSARKVGRQLFGRAHGSFRTRGRNSTATVRGTQWLTKDDCRGTFTSVQQGTVVVRDLVKRRTIVLRSGQHYLARRGNR
jgi:Ca2+-binding RTX toxin-like protein